MKYIIFINFVNRKGATRGLLQNFKRLRSKDLRQEKDLRHHHPPAVARAQLKEPESPVLSAAPDNIGRSELWDKLFCHKCKVLHRTC